MQGGHGTCGELTLQRPVSVIHKNCLIAQGPEAAKQQLPVQLLLLLLLLDVQFPCSCGLPLLLQLWPASEFCPCHDDSASSAWLLSCQQLLNLGQRVHLPQPQQLVRHLQATTAAQAQSVLQSLTVKCHPWSVRQCQGALYPC